MWDVNMGGQLGSIGLWRLESVGTVQYVGEFVG